MIGVLLKKIVGSKNERELKRIRPYVERINQIEPDIKALLDHQLKAKTNEQLGEIGAGEAMAATAVALLRKKRKRTL